METSPKLINFKDLPSPKSYPIVGNFLQYPKINKHQVLEQWAAELGSIYRIKLVGKDYLVSTDADFNRQVLKLRPKSIYRLEKVRNAFHDLGFFNVFSSEEKTWETHRKLYATMGPKKMKNDYSFFLDQTKNILSHFKEYANKDTEIDVFNEAKLFTTRLIGDLLLGYDFDKKGLRADQIIADQSKIPPMLNEKIRRPLPKSFYRKTDRDVDLEKSLKSLKENIKKIIANMQADFNSSNNDENADFNFLQKLLNDRDNKLLSDEEVLGNVFMILAGGEGTIAGTMAWVLYLLAMHPEITSKVRQEANEVYGAQEIPATSDQFRQLKYAEAVVSEVLRLKPPVPLILLESREEVLINNIVIPPKMGLVVLLRGHQILEDNFSKADEFIPERWLQGGCPMHNNHVRKAYIPFGHGGRICPGMHLSIYELVTVVSVLSKHFDFQLSVKPEEVKENHQYTMHPDNVFIKLKTVS